MKINILGTDYKITKKKYTEDEYFKKNTDTAGYCDGTLCEIVYCDMSTYPDWENDPLASIASMEKQMLRHEIIHAFLNESGLQDNSLVCNGAWARNEEMVDWMAIQFPKILEAFKSAQCL